MRIISGKLKGRYLASFKADHIRPTTDRVKESIFNILQGNFIDANVLDLFSGTGNLSIESYSRGAKSVLAVEMHPLSLKIINENIKAFNLQDFIQVQKADVLKFLKSYQGIPFDVVLIDPPFTKAMAHETMEHVAKSSIYNDETIIMIESSAQERLDEIYLPLTRIDKRDFGDKVVSFFKRGDANES